MSLIEKAKAIILDEIRKAPILTEQVVITIERVTENVDLFNQALVLPEVQRELENRGLTVVLRAIMPAVEQAKSRILECLRQVHPETREIVYPCLAIDERDYHRALYLPEVAAEFERRNINARIQVVDREQSVLIGSLDDFVQNKNLISE